MVIRKRIGLSYSYNENWIGGTYYIENLIAALELLPDDKKPHIVLITNNAHDAVISKKKISYPYISYQISSGEKSNFYRFINRVSNKLFAVRLFSQQIKNLDAVFPYSNNVQHSLAKTKIYWIADFQEHFVPEFFSEGYIAERRSVQLVIQSSQETLVLSSNDALSHFESLYPNHKVKTRVIPFAVTHPNFENLAIQELLSKFNLPSKYFICPNQFWKHKNHFTVLQAVKELKDRKIEITVAFTGKQEDYRNPTYYSDLLSYVDENNLHQNIKFLGFIDRAEQLRLMDQSVSVIQPSLFEGWSTVVEDSKSLNKALIVSNIKVHVEQLIDSTAIFFDPHNKKGLADILENVHNSTSEIPLYDHADYRADIKKFGENFMSLLG
ncbi:glycosyltransferase [Pedobacter sp. G11]|uniref:glycosyltransferase n=1 Tax=Pedobacter sp. G11 TaxID=2482728 RepID=UPI000F5E62C4|nr:glycosyltransferase [Pedobacter sp. G11]AZI25847.1 glycosyltransferase [Pedobacter sp. G11]